MVAIQVQQPPASEGRHDRSEQQAHRLLLPPSHHQRPLQGVSLHASQQVARNRCRDMESEESFLGIC